MKLSFIILISLILGSCAHKREDNSISASKICSEKSVEYLKQNLELVQEKKLTVEKGGPIIQKLQPKINKCMLAEALRTNKTEGMQFCLVAGFDHFGQSEFFEISSKVSSPSWELSECLNNLKNEKEFEGLKSAIIYTPIEFIY